MHTIGIIAEYNPFHKGHLFQYEWIKEHLGEKTAIVVALTSNFCQRGNLAIQTMKTRSLAAVRSGADLVLLFPQYYSITDAEAYAKAGIYLLSATGIIHTVAASSEYFKREELEQAADLISPESEELRDKIRGQIAAGHSPHQAREKAFEDMGVAESIRRCFREPNSRLVVEYLSALKMLDPSFRKPGFFLCPRRSGETGQAQASASEIRLSIQTSEKKEGPLLNKELFLYLRKHIPSSSLAFLLEGIQKKEVGGIEAFAELARFLLLREEPDRLKQYRYMQSGLAERLRKLVYDKDYIEATKTLAFSEGRIQRALSALALGIDQSSMKRAGEVPRFILPLAFNKKGRYLLRKMQDTARLPLLSKFSDSHAYRDEALQEQCLIERRSFALRALLTKNYEEGGLLLEAPFSIS